MGLFGSSGPKPTLKKTTRGGRIEWEAKCPDEEGICGKQVFRGPDERSAKKEWEKHDERKHKPERRKKEHSEETRNKQEKQLNRKLARELTKTEMRIALEEKKNEIREREEAEQAKREGWNTGNKKINGLYTPKGYKVGGVEVPEGQNVNTRVFDANGKRITRKMMGLDDD